MKDGLVKNQILIAEDSPTQAEHVRLMLETEGYCAAVARDGQEALDRVQADPPDLILSDVVMPRMDGFGLCHALKSSDATRAIPFVMLTSQTEPGEKARALDEGADDFLAKPADRAELLARVRSLLRVKQLHDQLQEANRELRGLTSELEVRVAERTAELRTRNDEVTAMSQQLWQAAKLATMGELAASVAHEINNPLATISLRLESLLAQTGEDDRRRRPLEIIEGEIERMAGLVKNLLEFGRRSQRQISTVNVAAELERTIELVDYHLRSRRLSVVQEIAPDLPMLLADRQQIRQLFLNLVTNAGDAMPEGGTLTIRVSRADDRFLALEFADTGIGIAPDDLPRVLEPFFTTKGDHGTGLGLPICHRIVQEHRGKLEITSSVGLGTTVHLTLPVANAADPPLAGIDYSTEDDLLRRTA